MANAVLIIGSPGTGKSTSIQTLDPKSTFLINVIDKPLPFRGHKKKYIKASKDGGNLFVSDNYAEIIKAIRRVSEMEQFKCLIIDDWQYVLANEFMMKAMDKGFDKFSEIAQHAWLIIKALREARDDLVCFVLAHSELDQYGRAKCKTIGKLLDEKISIEGLFTTVLHSDCVDGKYYFKTQTDGILLAKSPAGMFDELEIDNDLQYVYDKIFEYNEGE